MEMFHVRYVLRAAKTLNFTRAANELNVSQPALTKGVKSLEEELGAPIFHRKGRSLALTDFGNSILPHLEQILERTEQTRTMARNYRLLSKVPLRLGILSTIGSVRLSRFLARFQQEHDGVEVAVHEAGISELLDKLEDGELDLAILSDLGEAGERAHTTPLYEERYVVICPPHHRLERQNTVTLADLDGEPYVDRLSCEMRDMVMGVCESREVSLYARFRSEREDWVQSMVLARIGFAFMPEYSVTLPELVQRPLTEPEVSRKVVLAHAPGRQFSPAAETAYRAIQRFPWPG